MLQLSRAGVGALCTRVAASLFCTLACSTNGMTQDAEQAAPVPVPVPMQAPVQAPLWGSCGVEFPGVQCARVDVPMDYAQPQGATTTLALARVPAPDAAQKVGTLFLNPGGPGGSGVDEILNGFGGLLSELLLGRFDIVGFDPRGVHRSDPIQCFATAAEAEAFHEGTPRFPFLPEQELPYYTEKSQLWQRCLERDQPLLAHMSTADVARDLDRLRQAVGDSALTYFGTSYGSFLGTTYANLFPDNVRALVIDGVIDPRLWATGTTFMAEGVGTAEEWAEFLRLCDEAGESCGLSGPAGAAARYAQLGEALRSAPLVFGSGFVYTYDQLVLHTSVALYQPEYWSAFATVFGLFAEAAAGDAAALVQAELLASELSEELDGGAEGYDNEEDAYYATQCSDAEFPESFGEYSSIGSYVANDSSFGPRWWWSNAACAGWPTAQSRYTGPWSAQTSAPVLVVGNYFDGVTDYSGAVATSELLPNSRLLSYAGWGHAAFGRSDCVTETVVDYLLDGVLPPEGTVCPANPNPFLAFPLAPE